MTEKKYNDKDFLKEVEKAASRGVTKSNLKSSIITALMTAAVIGLIAFIVFSRLSAVNEKFRDFFRLDEPVADHDVTLENNGIFGYTAADFEEAILGDSAQLKKIEVFSQEISDVATLTDTGMFNWSVFTKVQLITYNGTAVYTVDLSKFGKSDIIFNEEDKTITMKIPHAQLEPINIPEDQIHFGDVNRGILAFGDMNIPPEQTMAVQGEARKKMEEKLVDGNIQTQADRFAILTIWELYSPIIKSVSKDYSLVVEFK
ncbi:MAG: DUF4230 domain-containing protein [Solobacterium sp.]|nr:DUF4230 domain-containing protein [Solobacterium sp.]